MVLKAGFLTQGLGSWASGSWEPINCAGVSSNCFSGDGLTRVVCKTRTLTALVLRSKVQVPLMKASKICMLTGVSNKLQMDPFQPDSITALSRLPIIRDVVGSVFRDYHYFIKYFLIRKIFPLPLYL